MLENLEAKSPARRVIHVFLDNARFHHAKILQPWLKNSERRVKLHFVPPYAPHLNPIERFWDVMHKRVIRNHHYATFNQCTKAILGFFRKNPPEKWQEFTNTITDNFSIISLNEYKVIGSDKISSIQPYEYKLNTTTVLANVNLSSGACGHLGFP